ncbi:hypothetical protein [Sphingomicrobium arenosum]|uniref:hypothetical protein n=1 Tax=Sphingomicrobium arenosum TaxID=2233861 RepID=UPI002240BA47|nr:hypothetical protein [Sphingomicrobium arenosum]
MRLALLACLALAACAQEVDTPVVESDAADAEVFSPAGMTFEVEGEEGVTRTYFGPDGTYIDFDGDIESGRGSYEVRPDGQLCFTPDDPDAGTACWTNEGEPDADGWMTSRRVSDGLTIRARPIIGD